MSVKKPVVVTDRSVSYIQARNPHPGSEPPWSRAINCALDHLGWITVEVLPELSETDWELILNVYSGATQEFYRPFRLANDCMDYFGAKNIGGVPEKYQDTVQRLQELTQAEQYAVFQFVEVFWCNNFSRYHTWPDIYKAVLELMQ